MGTHETFKINDPTKTARDVMDLTHGLGCPPTIEATELQAPLDLPSELCSERGRLIIAGHHEN